LTYSDILTILLLAADRERFAGRHTVVLGADYSAATPLSNLLTLGGKKWVHA
jgi:hypothetical protein